MSAARPIRAVLWDFGGVILDSPFEAFRRYEKAQGLPPDFIRRINSRNPSDNAWARHERGEIGIDAFCRGFESEAAALGMAVDARTVLGLLYGALRPRMVAAVRALSRRYVTACLTNNFPPPGSPNAGRAEIDAILALFDEVVESSKIGIRKPEPRFYEIACERLSIEPDEAVFLDDLGINLKPARALGMRTIKVVSPEQALGDLEAVLGHAI